MDREEFTSFYAASFPRLVGQLYAMTGDRAEAQDAVQEAFVRAWVHRGQIDTDRGAEAWVRVTAWRIAASRWRRRLRGQPRFWHGDPDPDRDQHSSPRP